VEYNSCTAMSRDRTHAPFQNTQWTLLLQAKTENLENRRKIEGAVLGQYWMPVYSYLRRKGHSGQEAEDLTQGFFAEKVLDRDLLEKADREKGKFRTFLLTALDRYVSNEIRRRKAKKRMPQGGVVQLENLEAWQEPEAGSFESPDAAFSYVWASRLLDDALKSVKATYYESDREKYWEVFNRVVIGPTLENTSPPSMQQLCDELGIQDTQTASNMNTTVKRCFRNTVRMRIRQFVENDGDIDPEIQDLINSIISSEK